MKYLLLILRIFHDSPMLSTPPLEACRIFPFPSFLNFTVMISYQGRVWPDGHLVGLFNLEIHFLQIDPLCWIISWMISSLPFLSLLSFHDSYYLGIVILHCLPHFFLFHVGFHFFPSNFWEITSSDLSSRPNIQKNYLGLFVNFSFIIFRQNKRNHKRLHWPSSSNLPWFSSWTIR